MLKHSRTISKSVLTSLDELYTTDVTFDASDLQQSVTNGVKDQFIAGVWLLLGVVIFCAVWSILPNK